jgi:hypothetical protein
MHHWRDGTTHLLFEPLDLVGKLAALEKRGHPPFCASWSRGNDTGRPALPVQIRTGWGTDDAKLFILKVMSIADRWNNGLALGFWPFILMPLLQSEWVILRFCSRQTLD